MGMGWSDSCLARTGVAAVVITTLGHGLPATESTGARQPAQTPVSDLIRLYVFAPGGPDRHQPAEVNLPPRHPVPRDKDPYYYHPRHGRQAVTALSRELRRESHRRVALVVDARTKADVFVEIVATGRGTMTEPQPRDFGIVVIRVTVRHHSFTTDFIGEHRGVLRPPAYDAAGQLTRWLQANHATLQRLIYGFR